MRASIPGRAVALALLTLTTACKEYSVFSAKSDSDEAGGAWGDTGASDVAPGDAGDDDGYGSETETDRRALLPASTQRYVFVANPSRNTLSRISVPALAVITTEVGIDPEVVLTTPDFSKAVVFNRGSDDVSIVDAETLAVDTVPVRDDFNAMVLSPDGRWAAVYFDAEAEDALDPSSEGTQSFNEVSFVQVDKLEHHPMVVGFDPHEVQFTDDGHLAVVVSDTYLALVDLDAGDPQPVRVQITDDLVDPPAAEEVLLTPDGHYAFVRQYGVTSLTVVDLQTCDVDQVDVGDNPTDLDVMPDGSHAVAVARGSGELWLYSLDDPFAEPEVVQLPSSGIFGSVVVSPDGSQGLLYSTASGQSLYAAWDPLATNPDDAVVVRGLVKPVDNVVMSPDGGSALVFHTPDNGDLSSDSPFYNAWAISLIDLQDYFANPLRLAAEPLEYVQTDDGKLGYFVMDGEQYLEMLDYHSLLYREIPLPSDPVHLGALLDARTAWVSQDYELGRISFYDPDDGQAGSLSTITGFELNEGIETQ